VPYAFQAVAAGADDERAFLAALGAPLHGGEVVAHALDAVEQVIEVLDLGHGAQAAQGHAHALAQDGGFADAHVAHAQFAEAGLHAFHALVHVADLAGVLAEGEQQGFLLEERGEVVADDDAAIHLFVAVVAHRHLGTFKLLLALWL
jgi:hypothetical protein